MGFDYSYITVIKKTDEPKLTSFIARHVSMEDTGYGVAATIAFESDEAIRQYLTDSLNELESDESPYQILNALNNERVEIGLIYLDTREAKDSPYIFTRFTAATTNMSLLFYNSISIRDWFIDFGKHVNAMAVFLDLEDEDYKFIFKEGECVDVPFSSGTEFNGANFYKEIIKNYQIS